MARRTLSDADVNEMLRTEITDRFCAADDYDRGGRTGQAERLRSEASVLIAQLPAS